ncbi:MAG: SUMF1/EgtB/PvdO family nonheme iron enzyme [Hyphomonas sp.]|nr:SUMF1/EgtB/PvdO family nonheme iron enzyme [Hyphomonas sp.]
MIQDAERPIMFELTQTADLIGWDGDREEARWKEFVADIRLALERSGKSSDDAPKRVPAAATAPDATIENTFWTSIKDSDDEADFEAYLSRYPDGHFVDLARNRLTALSRTADEPASAPTPMPAPAAVPSPAPEPVPAPAAAAAAGNRPNPVILGGGALAIAAAIAIFAFGGSGTSGDAGTGDDETPAGPVMFADCDTCPSMVVVPAGTFSMGSEASEPGRTGNEGPLHLVTLSAFAIGETEVTFDEWDACVADDGCGSYSPPDRDYGRGTQPVIGVSWYDAGAYASWLSRKTGRTYRLPTEAEWEYAARADTATPYWWGDRFDPAIAPVNAPVPPDTLAANPFGLKAMLGNAREWVEDCYINNYTDAPTDGSARHDGDCARRILRGGAWGRDADDHRAANRARIDASVRDKVFGFRLVTTDLPEASEE